MLRKDDPVYYKDKLKTLLQEAKDNGIKVDLSRRYCDKTIFRFKNDIGECASVEVVGEIS